MTDWPLLISTIKYIDNKILMRTINVTFDTIDGQLQYMLVLYSSVLV
jgi:hypothetical protein